MGRAKGIRLGLRGKLTLAALVLVCTPLLVTWSIGVYERIYRAHIVEDVGERARELAQRFQGGGVDASAGLELERYARDHHLMVRVLDRRGQVLRRTSAAHAERWSNIRGWWRRAGDFFFGPAGPPDLIAFEASLPAEPERPEVRAALAGKPRGLWRFAEDSRMFIYYRAQPLPDRQGVLYLTSVSRRTVRALYDLRFQMLKLTLILAVVAALMGLWLGWRFVNPLIKIQQRIGAYLRSPRGPAPGPLALERRDELGDLSRGFQELVDRLRQQQEQAASAAGDLAHDLKGPIATVGATAELLQAAGELDEERRQTLASSLADSARHMGRSVEGMLELARLDQSLDSAERTEIDLERLLRRALQELEADPRAACVELELRIETGAGAARVLGAEPQLERLLRNLLDNALAFCESRVEVTLQGPGEALLLTVCDDGPGVSEGNRDKVFVRFFSARPKEAGPGTGLGLSIVEAIARAHGGRVTLAEGPLPGACFQVQLPSSVNVKDTPV